MSCGSTLVAKPGRSQSGFTLLELVVVLVILSVVALGTLAVTDQLDSQRRYEESRQKWEMMRTAIIGEPNVFLNNSPKIGGFWSDIGRLPTNLLELLVQPGNVSPWTNSLVARQASGWRGPYLPVVIDSDNNATFRDGWGNPGAVNSGWRYEFNQFPPLPSGPTNASLLVQSLGSDWVAGGVDYAEDFPLNRLVAERDDGMVNIAQWRVRVRIIHPNPPPTAFGSPGTYTLRLMLMYPKNGSFSWTNSAGFMPANSADRDSAEYLSLPLTTTITTTEIPKGSSREIEFDFGPGPNGMGKFIPWGNRTMFVIQDGPVVTPFPPPAGLVAHPNQYIVVTLIPRTQLPSPIYDWYLQ